MMPTRLAFLTAAVTLGCWDVPPGDKTSPYFWSDLFLDKYAEELIIGDLEAGPTPLATPRTVLLITGVTIKAEWFDPIVARLQRDGFVPVVYEPAELLSGDLFEASAELAKVVEQVRADSGQAKIDILAECTGGLIARHYIQSLGGDAAVSRLVTFVSPQHGIDNAPLAAAIAGWPALEDLSPGSAFLEAVNNAPLPQNVPITSIYTCQDEYIQPYETSIIPGATNIGLCDGFVGHFQTFYDPSVYLVMHTALTTPLANEPAVIEPEPTPEVEESEETAEAETETTPEVEETESEPAVDGSDSPTAVDETEPEATPVDDPGAPMEVAPAEVDPESEAAEADGPGPESHLYLDTGWKGGRGVGCSSIDGQGSWFGFALLAFALLVVRNRMTATRR